MQGPTEQKCRIRLDEETSGLLREMLHEYLTVWWDVRAQRKRDGDDPHFYNRRITITKRLMGEVNRAMEEVGWLTNDRT